MITRFKIDSKLREAIGSQRVMQKTMEERQAAVEANAKLFEAMEADQARIRERDPQGEPEGFPEWMRGPI